MVLDGKSPYRYVHGIKGRWPINCSGRGVSSSALGSFQTLKHSRQSDFPQILRGSFRCTDCSVHIFLIHRCCIKNGSLSSLGVVGYHSPSQASPPLASPLPGLSSRPSPAPALRLSHTVSTPALGTPEAKRRRLGTVVHS